MTPPDVDRCVAVPLTCQFCGDDDFDLYGLQDHLQFRCDVFGRVDSRNNIPAPPSPAKEG